YGDLNSHVLVQEMIREMIGAMVEDVLEETESRLQDSNPQSPDDIRAAGRQMVAFSEDMREKVDELRGFLFERMYHHYTMNRIHLKVERIICDLFTAFTKNYEVLPNNWQRRVREAGGIENEQIRVRIVADYIAGMTDRYAIREHERLFDLYWDLK
ncbi:MAG TPA: deoxyguanosinetriphosphate triphosphohydrolase, partial [Alphaproteobacteria bacterium]|nr:deoxyguanosinetriphosphate triphosphohydrolase [Alphaproteobacteria bacterium]